MNVLRAVHSCSRRIVPKSATVHKMWHDERSGSFPRSFAAESYPKHNWCFTLFPFFFIAIDAGNAMQQIAVCVGMALYAFFIILEGFRTYRNIKSRK